MIDLSEKIKAKFTPIIQDKEPEKWEKLRTTGIGGSDAGAILGLNPYSSPLTIYMAKKDIKSDFTGNNTTEWGHILEDPIRKQTANELGIAITQVPGMYTSLEYDWMNANVDGICVVPDNHVCIVNGTEITGIGGHEIKTSSDGTGFSDSEIPDSYYAQVQHYMAVTGLDWFILTVFILRNRTAKHYVVRRNEEFIEKLIEVEKDFWENNILANNMPAPSGTDSENNYLNNLPISDEVILDEMVLSIIQEEREINRQIKELEQKQTILKNQIITELYKASQSNEPSAKTTAVIGNYKITYNTQVRKSVDSDALKKAGLYEQYSTESVSKVLRITENKK